MLFGLQRPKCREDIIKFGSKWKAIAIDLVEAIFRLNEDRLWRFAPKG